MANKDLSIASLGYNIFASSLDNLPKKHQTIVHTLNQYSFCVAKEDLEFKNALQKADVLLPDGIAIVYAVKLLIGKKIKKIAGADLHEFCLKKLNKESGKCFYLGASNHTLEKIKTKINLEYPNINIETFSPPFKQQFSAEDNAEMIAKVNDFKPDVLFVGMTAPKQEKWATANQYQLDAQLICSIGAVFDFYAGTVERPSKTWINLGIEWLGRLVKEPKRMWKRYLYFGPIFIIDVLKQKITNNNR
jgi:N-acetylglucosaminyldiphosphoundecaprenol N-acetyl-beta-D-mannosaminyltransferase